MKWILISFYFFSSSFSLCLAQPFASPVLNPFSLQGHDPNLSAAFGDLDDDGDLDILTGAGGGFIQHYINTGNAYQPNFQINSNYYPNVDVFYNSMPSLADVDSDGDLDLIVGSAPGNIRYYENHGTAQLMQFDSLTWTISAPYWTCPTFVDLDNDNDYDILSGNTTGDFYYYENIGDSSAPNFQLPIVNPFSLSNANDAAHPSFCDFDNDGDLDMISSSGSNFRYYENIGTTVSPNFNTPINNPFSITYNSTGDFFYFVDLNSDGDYDILRTMSSSDFMYYENLLLTNINNPGEQEYFFNFSIDSKILSIGSNTSTLDRISIYNNCAQLCFTENCVGKYYSKALDYLDAGMYFVIIQSNNNFYSRKIIKY